jgi:hypothetical protein
VTELVARTTENAGRDHDDADDDMWGSDSFGFEVVWRVDGKSTGVSERNAISKVVRGPKTRKQSCKPSFTELNPIDDDDEA